MGDYSNYGGSDEENAEIKKLNAEVVSPPMLCPPRLPVFSDPTLV
jgi:hypothetical protein